MQQLQPLVANSKLDRPLDSHPPLSRESMLTRLEADDWGDTYEDDQYNYQDHDSWQEHESWQEHDPWQEHEQQEHDQQEHEHTE
jgi:hypothetical protein